MPSRENGIDIEALKKKYREERDKRVRKDGPEQYLKVDGEYTHFYDVDVADKADADRKPVTETTDVAVLGGGFAGLLSGANLRKAGLDDFRIIELGRDFGGTWYWNKYPGVQCDVESYCYMPILEEMNYVPTKKYADGREIHNYCLKIAERFRLYDNARFGLLVTALRWDCSEKLWCLSTSTGDEIRARFVIMCNGPFSRPKLPGIAGIHDFKGHSFHTSRWDYDYTGGGPDGGLTRLHDKRVAIIGTGATALQCVPHLGRDSGHLYVFQRTPTAVSPRSNRPTDPEWAKTLRPGWQKARRDNLNALMKGLPCEADLIQDGWTDINRKLIDKWGTWSPEEIGAFMEAEDYRKMESIRQNIANIVKREDVAETLKPWYRFYCKRPTFSDEYLPTFNRDNVTLVDVSSTQGVERITERGVVAGGIEYEVDCIVYASGFDATAEPRRRIGIPVIEGRGGLSLYDHWADGLRTLHGFTTTEFPNLFFTGYTQVAISANYTSMLEDQIEHITYIIAETIGRGADTVEPTPEAQGEWVDTIHRLAVSVGDFWHECTPGYYNNEGRSSDRSDPFGDDYTPGVSAFNALLKEWRDKGDLQGLALGRETVSKDC